MAPKLTKNRRHARQIRGAAPIYLVDQHSRRTYVLLPEDEYMHLRPLIEPDDFSIGETYAEQDRIAGIAGWNDPTMAEYDEYAVPRPRP